MKDSVEAYYKTGEWTKEKTERAIIDLCKRINKYGPKLELADLKSDPYCSMIPDLSLDTIQEVMESVQSKLLKGIQQEKNQVFYHTGPHHDDIPLGMQPHVNRILREPSNKSVFSVLTSGFTAVTNRFVTETLDCTKKLLDEGRIQMIKFPDFFESGYKYKWDKDVYHFLLHVASDESLERVRGLCHRVVRAIVEIWAVRDYEELRNTINAILSNIRDSYDGQKNPPKIQKLKGMIREFEEELVWAHSECK